MKSAKPVFRSRFKLTTDSHRCAFAIPVLNGAHCTVSPKACYKLFLWFSIEVLVCRDG